MTILTDTVARQSEPVADVVRAEAQPAEARAQLRRIRSVTIAIAIIWLVIAAGLVWWISDRLMTAEVNDLAASADYETVTTTRVVDRLFTEMESVSNMVASQAQVIALATRYRTSQPGYADLEREQRAVQFTGDPLARQVGNYMNDLAADLRYARIYLTNMSDDTVIASNWAADDSIVGMIYTGRPYLLDALADGNGSSFGIARLLKTPSYFVASRVDDSNGTPLGAVTIKFDAPDVAHYLTGRHVALIVNPQGRVITASSEAFMLRNVATLLPPDTVAPPDGEEELGDPVDIRQIPGKADQWLVDGVPYLLRQQQLTDMPYKLLTLASLERLGPMHIQQLAIGALGAGLGLALVLLGGRTASQFAERRLRAEQERVIQIHEAAERDLTIKVHERTAELAESNASLEAEVDRRHGLEVRLRESLDSVNSALAQQRDFVALVSHEFRGPLAVIAAAADNISHTRTEEDDAITQRTSRIRQTVKRMTMLIENVLAGDRVSAEGAPRTTTELFDLNDMMSSAPTGLDDDSASRVQIVHADKAMVNGDRYLLEVALQNLIQNALKYSPAPNPVTVRLSVDGGVASVEVSDQGPGVRQEDRELIFAKYYRAAGQRTKGSGLGLFLSREIARQHGGDLVLAASGTGGSTFRLSLPVTTA